MSHDDAITFRFLLRTIQINFNTTLSATTRQELMKSHPLKFSSRLIDSRLGERHNSLDDFRAAQKEHGHQPVQERTECSVVVVTEALPETKSQTYRTKEDQASKSKRSSVEHNSRILLCMKNRGSKSGFYTSFGGRFRDEKESPEACACRELEEGTTLKITIDEMAKSKVGVQKFTFESDPVEVIMHVFRIKLEKISMTMVDSQNLKGCEEAKPIWHYDLSTIPFDKMFADNSVWLTALLKSSIPLKINGWYHFKENRHETNTILRYYLNIQPKKSEFSMEQRLFHTLHDNHSNLLSIKEFKECYAFCNAVRTAFSKYKHKNGNFDIVIDVAGGHGALAALFLICTTASHAVVVDPANVGGGRIQQAWGTEFMKNDKKLKYRRECLRTGLPDELEKALKITNRSRILVVACHACQHLSEEILQIACRYRVHVAVMPCCQKDRSPGSPWKAVSKNLSVPVAKVIDILQCGKIMALGSHDVRLKCIDAKITPQNRIIGKLLLLCCDRCRPTPTPQPVFVCSIESSVCRALTDNEVLEFHHQRQYEVDKAHSKLELVYRKAHTVPDPRQKLGNGLNLQQFVLPSFVWYIAAGFAAGVLSASSLKKK